MAGNLCYIEAIAQEGTRSSIYASENIRRKDGESPFRNYNGNGEPLKPGNPLPIEESYRVELARSGGEADLMVQVSAESFTGLELVPREGSPDWEEVCNDCPLQKLQMCEGFQAHFYLPGIAIMRLTGEQIRQLATTGDIDLGNGETVSSNCADLSVPKDIMPQFN